MYVSSDSRCQQGLNLKLYQDLSSDSISMLGKNCETAGHCPCGSMAAHICLRFECARPWYRSLLYRYAERDGLVKALCPWESWWQQCQIPCPTSGLLKSCKIYCKDSKANIDFGFNFVQHEPPSTTQLSALCKRHCQGHKSEWQVACGIAGYVEGAMTWSSTWHWQNFLKRPVWKRRITFSRWKLPSGSLGLKSLHILSVSVSGTLLLG